MAQSSAIARLAFRIALVVALPSCSLAQPGGGDDGGGGGGGGDTCQRAADVCPWCNETQAGSPEDNGGVKCKDYGMQPLRCVGLFDNPNFASKNCCICQDNVINERDCSILHEGYNSLRDSRFACSVGGSGIFTCEDGFVRESPPLDRHERIHMNMSIVLMMLDTLDEQAGEMTVRADIQMWWRDCRWSRLLEAMSVAPKPNNMSLCPSYKEAEYHMSILQGFTSDFKNMVGRALRNFTQATGCPTLNDGMWTPVPFFLKPEDAENTQSGLDGDVLYRAQSFDAGVFTAIITEQNKVTFPVHLDYKTFPFDSQTVKLKIPLDRKVHGNIVQDLVGPDGQAVPLDMISKRSRHPYTASALSPHLSQHLLDSFEQQGFRVTGVSLNVEKLGGVHIIVIDLKFLRIWYPSYVTRLFLPMFMLTSVPFAGFLLPVQQVMPRVATGFISFLALNVFRGMASSMVPKNASEFLWLDALLLVITEIMWLAVVQNVFAQWCYAKRSHIAAKFMDSQSTMWFPIFSVVTALFLTFSGGSEWRPDDVLAISQTMVALFVIFLVIRVSLFLRNLDKILLQMLVKDMCDSDAWSHPLQFDKNELGLVFRYIDRNCGDGSGFITGQELLDALKKHGLIFSGDHVVEQEATFVTLFTDNAKENDFSYDGEMGIDDFIVHCHSVVGRLQMQKIKKRVVRHSDDCRRALVAFEVPLLDVEVMEMTQPPPSANGNPAVVLGSKLPQFAYN